MNLMLLLFFRINYFKVSIYIIKKKYIYLYSCNVSVKISVFYKVSSINLSNYNIDKLDFSRFNSEVIKEFLAIVYNKLRLI